MQTGPRRDVEFKIRSRLNPVRVPPGRTSFNLRPRTTGKAPTGLSARINLDVEVDGKVYKTIPVYFDLTHYHHVVVTSRVVRAGHKLNGSNVQLRRVVRPFGSTVQLSNLKDVMGMVAARNLRAGEQLTLSEIKAPAIVRRNEVVDLVITKGRIRINTRVRALEDGAKGQVIQVRTLHARGSRFLTATVVAPGLLIIR